MEQISGTREGGTAFIEKPDDYTSIVPFGVDEVMVTRFYNGEMIQITRKRTKEEDEQYLLNLNQQNYGKT